MVLSAIAGIVFMSAVAAMYFAYGIREEIGRRVYRQNRYERLLPDERGGV